MIIPVIVVSAIIYSMEIILLSIGFTLTYLTAKIPNLAHGTYAGFGIYISYTFCKIFHYSPYVGFPVAFIIGGLISGLIYFLIIKVLTELGEGEVVMTISTIAIQILLTAFLGVYAFWIRAKYSTYAQSFLLKSNDFKIGGYQGVLLVSISICISTSILLHYILNKTKTGIAMRATTENLELAEILGVNTKKIQFISWFITGGMAALAGAMIPLWFQSDPMTGAWLTTSIMAASLLGGLDNIFGAIIGGLTIGFSEILLTRWLQGVVGMWVGEYRPMIPMILLVLVLLIEPRGLYGVYDRYKIGDKLNKIIDKLTRNKERA